MKIISNFFENVIGLKEIQVNSRDNEFLVFCVAYAIISVMTLGLLPLGHMIMKKYYPEKPFNGMGNL